MLGKLVVFFKNDVVNFKFLEQSAEDHPDWTAADD
jgi:hypothetical protein